MSNHYYIDSDYITTILDEITDKYKKIVLDRTTNTDDVIKLRKLINKLLDELEVEYHLLLYRGGGRTLPEDYKNTFFYLEHLLKIMNESIDLNKAENEPFIANIELTSSYLESSDQ